MCTVSRVSCDVIRGRIRYFNKVVNWAVALAYINPYQIPCLCSSEPDDVGPTLPFIDLEPVDNQYLFELNGLGPSSALCWMILT